MNLEISKSRQFAKGKKSDSSQSTMQHTISDICNRDKNNVQSNYMKLDANRNSITTYGLPQML